MKALKAIKNRSVRVARGLALTGLGVVSFALVPLAAAELPAGLDLRFELVPAAPLAVPPLPPTGVFPVQLVLDDDTAEGTVGVSDGSGAREFLWFNRFTPAGAPFDLAEVWVLFPADPNIAPGDAVQIAVYLDPDGDPTNGADLLATFAETVQVADGNTFSIYPLAPAVPIYDPGDVLIGVVPRFIEPGDPTVAPASVDTTASQQRSWIAIWTADPPDPPELPPDVLLDLIDNVAPAAAGNWMIRGFGVPAPVVVIPALGGFGLALLALVLGAAGLIALRRRHRRAAGMLGVIALAAAAALAPAPASGQVVIDEFTTNQGPVLDPPGGGSTVPTGGADILGGKRGVRVRNLAGPGPTSVEVAFSILAFTVEETTPDSVGEADVIWDGDADNDPFTFDPTGLGGVDLTDGGTEGGIRFTIEQARAGTHLALAIYEDADHVSRAGRVLPEITSTTTVFINFGELIADPDAIGPADLTQVGAVTLRLGAVGGPNPPALEIGQIATAGPAVAAAKVDTVGGVVVTGPQTPGTTLRYRVTIENPGAGAAEGVDFDDVVTDPNLGPPSAIRTTPLARRDQYVTVTDGPIDSAVDGAPSLLANDVDPDTDPLATVADPGQATAQGGTVTIDTDGHFVYTPPLGFVGVDAFNYTVAATAGDPTADAAGSPIGPIQSIAYVAIDRVPPVITAGGTLLYTENDGPQPIDPALTVVDVDSVNLFGATVEISANYVMGEDVLGFVDTANITGVFVPATGVLTLTGTDTVAAYEAALQSVTYENTSEDPSELDRTVTWTATDGGETSAPATSTIEVTSVNDAPIVTTSVGSTNFTEDGGPVVVDALVTVTDADHTSLASATVTITNLLDAGLETLAANTGGTSIVALYAAPTLTLTGPDTVANFQQVLQSVTYENASQDPNITDRIVRFVATDGTDPSAPADKTVTVTPQNDPPVAGDDLWHTIGNTQLNVDPDVGDPAILTPHVLDTTPGAPDGVRDNDADPAENDNHMVTAIVGCADVTEPFDCPTANGGTVSLEADGSFTYTPAPGDTAASDSFQYVLTDDGLPAPANDIGTVTIQRFERVWYVDNDSAAGGNGTSSSPFDSLAAINGVGGAGDSDSPNDYIFVHFGDGAPTGQTAGLALENGQRLFGEHAGLSIPVDLNGNGSPTVLHAGTPGSRPLIDRAGAGNAAISATDAIPAAIAGLSLLSAGGDAVDVTTNVAFAGSGTLVIRDNVVRGAATEGIDLNHGGTGAVNLALHDNTVTAGGRGIDVARTGGALTVTAFDDNVIHGDTVGSGIEVAGATFDATPGLPIQQVAGGVTLIGQSGNGVGTNGLMLTGVAGDLAFTDLDVFNDGGIGLRATSTGALNPGTGAGFRIAVPAGVATIDSNGGPAVDVNNASVTLPLGFLESTNSTTTGLSLVNAFGGVGQTALSASSGQISDPGGASGTAVNVSGGSGNVSLGIPVTNSSGNAVTISSRTSDMVSFTGAVTETGSGISLTSNGASATTVFAGGLSASTGASTAFAATSGGRLSICDENPCNVGSTGPLVNALTTTTATALNLSNTTITPDGVALRSINSTGASGNTAIVLANTGAGPFQVTGTGSAGTGGTIDNKTADGMTMNNIDGPVTLRHMIFEDLGGMGGGIDTISTHDAIHGQDVDGGMTLDGVTIRRISDNAIHGATLAGGAATVWNGLTLNNVTFEDSNRFHVAGAGDSNNEGMVRILGIRGPVSITNSTLQRGGELVDFFVTGGALTMTATNNNFHNAYKEFTSGPRSSVGGHCIDVTVQNAGDATVTIGDRVNNALDNDFLHCAIGSIRVAGDAGATGDVDVVIGQNEFTVTDHSSGIGGDFDFPQGGVLVGSLGTDTMTWDVVVDGNYFDEIANASGGVGQFTLAMTNGTWNVLVEDNTFDTPGNAPWFIRADSTTSARVMFRNNLGIKGAFCSTDPASNGGGCNLGAGQLCPGAAGFCGPGLRSLADLQNAAVLDLTIINDVFGEHDAGFDPGQTFESRVLPTGGGGTLCLDLQNNRAPDGYSLEEFAGDFNLVGSGTCPVGSPSAACATLLGARGNLGGANVPTTSPPFVNVEAGSTIDVVPGACLQPSGPIF